MQQNSNLDYAGDLFMELGEIEKLIPNVQPGSPSVLWRRCCCPGAHCVRGGVAWEWLRSEGAMSRSEERRVGKEC